MPPQKGPVMTHIVRNPLSRRGLLGLGGLGVAGLAFGLSGCASGSDGGTSGPVTLDVALWGDAKRAEIYEKVLALFGQRHPDVTTDLEFADLDPYLERLVTAAAARDLPDLLWMRDTHIGRYAESGALLDLSPYLGGVIDTSTIGESGVAAGRVGDGVFALPSHYVGQAVIQSRDDFATAQLDIAQISTWDELAAAATELARVTEFGIGDPTLGDTHRHLEAWIRQAGQELFNEEGQVGFDRTIVEEWLEFWSALRRNGVIPPPDTQIESDSAGWTNNLIVTGRSSVLLASTNHLSAVQQLTQKPLAMTSVPAQPGSTNDWWFFPPILVSAAANTPAPDRVAALIELILNDTEAGQISRLNQGAPSSSAVREALQPSLSEVEAAFIGQISREQENPSRPLPIRPEGAEALNTAITRAGQEVAYGRLSITEAVSTMMSDAQRALS
jgi:pectin-derived oligosaccharide transport system substrate-binding protein